MSTTLFFLVLVFWTGSGLAHRSTSKHGDRNTVLTPITRLLKGDDFDVWSLYLPTRVNSSSECGVSLQEMFSALQGDHITGAHKWMDAWGKEQGGWLVGVPPHFGNYDECQNTYFPNDQQRGRYCSVNVRKEKIGSDTSKKRLQELPLQINTQLLRTIEDTLEGYLPNGTQLTYYTCMPDACTEDDLKFSLIDVYNNTDFIVTGLDCHLDFRQDSLEPGDIGFISLLGFFALILLSASIVDIYIEKTNKDHLKKGGLRFLLPFSAYTNIQKLFRISPESPPGTITCLLGMRVLSMTWVVWAHQQSLTFTSMYNLFTTLPKLNGILFQVLLNGFPSVDTFFFMGGFLMSYNVLREFKRTGKFNLVMFYLHRAIRLIPPIAMVVALYSTITVYFMNSPLANLYSDYRKICQDGWWRDVFFADNFATINLQDCCIGQVWYVAVDTQIYIFAPLIFFPLLYKRKLGMVWLYIVTMVSILIPAIITYVNELPPTGLFGDPKTEDYFYYIYFMPWTRAGPIMIGIWLGVFIHDQGNTKIKLEAWQVAVGWTMAIGAGFLVVFGMWSYNIALGKMDYDVITAVLYSSMHRPVWAVALSWVVFACYNGYGGFVDDFLSHPIWQPMSRLTYSIYLVALSMQMVIAYNLRIPYYFNPYNKIIETFGAIMIAFIPSVLVTLTVESPIIGLEKLIFRKPAHKGSDSKVTKDQKDLNDLKDLKDSEGIPNEAFDEIVEVEERQIYDAHDTKNTMAMHEMATRL